MVFDGLGFTVQKGSFFCVLWFVANSYKILNCYPLGFTAKNNPKHSSLGFTVEIPLILGKCAFATFLGTFTCTMHLPKRSFRKIKSLPSTHIGEMVPNRCVPPKRRPHFIDFGQKCICTDFCSLYSPKHTQIAPPKSAISQNLNRYHQFTRHTK